MYKIYPILESRQIYNNDRAPGPDRVVYTPDGQYCGLITHTDVSVFGFQSCIEG
ncbi:hypothetical protein OF83DRAFT_1128251 [Amylostereum chailletii]|nr:hypothetical protein OF83DRAFT_1128251 [Amylostereum chailletii]